MPPVCQVCRHPEAARIALALVAGDSSRDVAGRFPGISKSAVARHRSHALKGAAIVRAVEARADREAETLVQEISRLKADAARLAAKAESEHDYRGALGAVKLLTDVALRLEELMPANETEQRVRVEFTFADSGATRDAEAFEARLAAQREAAAGRTTPETGSAMPEDLEAAQPILAPEKQAFQSRPKTSEPIASPASAKAPVSGPFAMLAPFGPPGKPR